MHKVLKTNEKHQKLKEGLAVTIVLCLAVSSVFILGHQLFDTFWEEYMEVSESLMVY